ncbi:uncharacterized protein LOC114240965 isoform X2 [Bombyx mandarina]|uniref:Uncharacterized protein LOC114240965 isoform X2 n=1 Tax=Bombyx mandarina TaxID=7092 RepID=A0A6J2JDS0_BOMMA|nr:uncharacterized protein LOC114240965 isoform X2 [Bombyx mandarina]
MNDPWDVKSVRQSGQYVSCMKINGVPLLPPVLSKECRKEMQYYKLLAKEVEKRISLLQPYIAESESESSEDRTDAPEIPESEEIQTECKITSVLSDEVYEKALKESPKAQPNVCNTINSSVTVLERTKSPKFRIDLNLNISGTAKNFLDKDTETIRCISEPVELPERDYDCNKVNVKRQAIEFEDINNDKTVAKLNFIIGSDKNVEEPFPDLPSAQDGPPSLSSKSFTGSLNDIHTDSLKESQIVPKLTRQRSYTLLKPSPQLLAHLEVESLNTGVEMSCISMSESLSNLSAPNKKRRSWDLETAKVKWSSMAMELKQKNVSKTSSLNCVNRVNNSRAVSKKPSQVSPPRARSVVAERPGRMSSKSSPKSEPIQKPKKSLSPVRNSVNINAMKEASPKTAKQNVDPVNQQPQQLISESQDPATRVRELYEKIQKQQLLQMASLVEKQKREQQLLQQVFEDQNNLLYKQLKMISPKSPIEIKEESNQDVSNKPVSLSQLINPKSPEIISYDSSVSSTLTDTNNYINRCEDILRQSRDITGSIKKQNGTKTQSPRPDSEGSRTRTHSPSRRSTSRKLNYDTSASSDRDYEQILTDRTNDTMADLNVTFPSDNSEEFNYNNTVLNHMCGVEVNVTATHTPRSREGAIRSMDHTLQSSMCALRKPKSKIINSQPTARERAAATKIVSYAKGYLVRRLMRTERVRGIVQTIKDALLCALQLHQEREGIRGADVDLHRRLIQQITAACYSLHDTFITSSPSERCAMIAADRKRKALANRPSPRSFRQTDV